VPTVKLTSVAVSGLPAARPTRPLTACCQATANPASSGNTASVSAAGSSSRPRTASPTASTVSIAPNRRRTVTGWRPLGPMPARSTSRLLADWPATTATVKTATPRTPTVRPCVATRNAPQSPPRHCHGRSVPAVNAARRAASPRRPPGVEGTSTSSTSRPRLNETTAAATPSASRTPNSPLIRDCAATATPPVVASTTPTSRRAGGGRTSAPGTAHSCSARGRPSKSTAEYSASFSSR